MKNNYLNCKALTLAMLISTGLALDARAQDCYSSSGCSNYSNFGYNSTSAATLEYDNYVSGFHQTVVRDLDGSFKVWGEKSKHDGVGALLVPTPINAGNYPGLTGTPLKAGIGSGGINRAQFILLTDDNKLWVWGVEGIMMDTSLTSGTAFQELSLGLPTGILATDVKMMFTSQSTIALTTCDGDVYVLSKTYSSMRGDGGSGSTTWARVEKQGGGFLTGIVATRGTSSCLIALDTANQVWSWGIHSWNGTTARVNRNRAVMVTPPAGATGSIKMIGATSYTNACYYALYENGNLYSLGGNTTRQLGNWTSGDQMTWVQPTYDSAGAAMDDIVWISPNEHDGGWANINVLSEGNKIYNWGNESGAMLGRGLGSGAADTLNPGEPDTFQVGYSNNQIISIETGGHTTMMLRECEDDFGYVGHRIRGSMGDNNSAEFYDKVVHFNTNAVHVCGAEVVEARLTSSLEGPYYVGTSVFLMGTPVGGTYTIDSSSTATATLVDSVISFTGAGTLRMNYTPPDVVGVCSTVVVNKTFNVTISATLIAIPGNIWNDIDGDAVLDIGESGLSNDTWANLTTPDGIIIASVKVNADGSYQFDVSTTDVSAVGDYSVVLTNKSFYKGDLLTVADTPSNGYEYTGTNRGATGADVTNKDGVLNIGDLSVVAAGNTTDPVNFGIKLIPPVATNDELTGQIPGTPATVPNILANDTDPNGGTLVPDSVTLVIPAGMPAGTSATATDAQGDITEITVPGEGVWVLNSDGTVTFTPEPTFFDDPTPIEYSVTNDAGSTSNTAEIIIDYNDIASVSGAIYHDGNGITGGVNGTPLEGATVTLYESDGVTVVATTITGADGSYSFDGIAPGDYIIGVTPLAGYEHSSSTDTSPLNGLTSVVVTGTADVQNINFGIQQPPTGDVKEYSVSNEAFTDIPPAGFPDISSPGDVWQVIPMSSSALTGTTGGALSGSDPEDCPTASSCSDGATFNIETINSNTRLFYDFGGATGVVEIDVTGGPVEIENFDVTKMIIWGQNGSGAAGDEIGFTYSITDQAGTSSDPVSYTIETATPLPIELLSFVAKLQNNNVLLHWATASEVNNKGFEIERSATGNNWNNIGFVTAATADGNSSSIQHYSFADSKPANGMNYYRLKQMDVDGKFNYSPVRSVMMQQQTSIAIQPNPAKDHIVVKGLTGAETIKIYSMHGRLVKEIIATGSTVTIALDELNAGMYHVNVMSASGVVFVSKVIKL